MEEYIIGILVTVRMIQRRSFDKDVSEMGKMVSTYRLIILWLDMLELDPNYVENIDDLFMYEDKIPQVPSSNVVTKELPNSPRRLRTGVKIECLLNSPKKKLEVNNAAKGREYKVSCEDC